MPIRSRTIAVAWIALFTACDQDQVDPGVEMIEVRRGTEVLGELDPSQLSDTTLEEDVPIDAEIVLLFNEPVTLSSAREKITLHDTEGGTHPIELKQRLDEITVQPEGGLFMPEITYSLAIAAGIQDTSGRDSNRNLTVNFYTVE